MIRRFLSWFFGAQDLTIVEQKRNAWSGIDRTPRRRFEGDRQRHQLRPLALVPRLLARHRRVADHNYAA